MIIGKAAMEEALAHLIERARADEEGVGLLSAPLDGRPQWSAANPAVLTNLAVTRWHALANVSEYPRLRYEVDPGELLAAYDALEADGHRPHIMVHSHLRTGVVPSATDVRYATNPGLLHLIVDLEGPRPVLALWRLHPGRALRDQEKVRFQVVDLREQENQATDLTHGVTDA